MDQRYPGIGFVVRGGPPVDGTGLRKKSDAPGKFGVTHRRRPIVRTARVLQEVGVQPPTRMVWSDPVANHTPRAFPVRTVRAQRCVVVRFGAEATEVARAGLPKAEGFFRRRPAKDPLGIPWSLQYLR